VSLATNAAQRDLSEKVRAWVERTCTEQGVSAKLSDPLAFAQIAVILGEARDARESDSRRRGRAA